MTLPLRVFVLATVALLLAAGCAGGAASMHPVAAPSADVSPLDGETRCAGDVCFSYARE